MWSPDADGPKAIDIPLFFRRYGWAFKTDAPRTHRTGFRGQHDTFEVSVKETDHWVAFTIHPLLQHTDHLGAMTLLALAHANHVSSLVKFGIDSDDEIVLTIEFPLDGFTYAHFAEALDSISQTADAFSVALLQATAIDRLRSN